MVEMSASRLEGNAFRSHNGNAILIESTKESVTEVLGENEARVLFLHLENDLNMTMDEAPHRLKDFFSALEDIFGDRGRTMAKAILRKLYTKLALHYVVNPDCALLGYVEDAMMELNRTQDDFAKEWDGWQQLPDLMATNRHLRATNRSYVI
jgi:hypothetical protein